jgi:hypothetical protein
MNGEQPSGPLVPYVFDNRRQKKRGKRINNVPAHLPGQRLPGGVNPRGGGGPENTGAKDAYQAGITAYQDQPSWRFEFENDFFGPAAPSTTRQVVATHEQPANSFRLLGDRFKARQ